MRTTGRNTAGIIVSMLYGVAVAGGLLLILIAIHVADSPRMMTAAEISGRTVKRTAPRVTR